MFEASKQGTDRTWIAVLVGAVSTLVVVGAVVFWATRLPAAAPPLTYTWRAPAGDPIAGVHVEHWPAWTVAKSRGSEQVAIETALEDHPALQSMAVALMAAADMRDLSAAGDAADVWNASLRAQDQPWALKPGATGKTLYVKTFFVLGRVEVETGDRKTEVSIGKRVDGLNVVEGYLGAAEDIGGALVVSDRVLEFATDDLWPLLGTVDDPIAVSLRAELAAGLPESSFEALTRTADARAGMVAANRAVRERRSCGSDFRMRVPWSGMDEFQRLLVYAERYRGEECPGLTAAEARALIRGTAAIRTEPGLWEALEQLVAWACRHVVVHEARHRLDQEDWGFGEPPPCEGCELSGRVRIEASAYVSAMASQESLAALVQVCGFVAATESGSSRRGAVAVLDALEIDCATPPPDVSTRAKALAKRWFSRDEEWTLHGMPDRVPLGIVDPE